MGQPVWVRRNKALAHPVAILLCRSTVPDVTPALSGVPGCWMSVSPGVLIQFQYHHRLMCHIQHAYVHVFDAKSNLKSIHNNLYVCMYGVQAVVTRIEDFTMCYEACWIISRWWNTVPPSVVGSTKQWFWSRLHKLIIQGNAFQWSLLGAKFVKRSKGKFNWCSDPLCMTWLFSTLEFSALEHFWIA